jgi:hypothetical protein
MAGSPKEGLGLRTEAELDELAATEGEQTADVDHQLYLRDGRRLTVAAEGADQLVEIRGTGGMLELRIRLTEQGPVLQMDAVRLQLKASEAVEIASPRVEIKASEALALAGKQVTVEGEEDVKVDAKGEVRVTGTRIYLN